MIRRRLPPLRILSRLTPPPPMRLRRPSRRFCRARPRDQTRLPWLLKHHENTQKPSCTNNASAGALSSTWAEYISKLGLRIGDVDPDSGDPYGSVQFVAAFPGWTGYIGTNQVSAALYNRAL